MVINIGAILQQWGNWGVYDYILPALLIFAVVFGILRGTKLLGEHKGVHVIVALVIAIMAVTGLQRYVGSFYQQIFPRLGVGLAVIVSLVILTSLFINNDELKYWMWGISAVGVVIWIIATAGAFGAIGTWIGYYGSGEDLAALVIGALLLVGVIIAVGASGSKKEEKKT